jgi:hypothetical protein
MNARIFTLYIGALIVSVLLGGTSKASADVINIVSQGGVTILTREIKPQMNVLVCVSLAGGFSGFGVDQTHLVRFSRDHLAEKMLKGEKFTIADLKAKKVVQSYRIETLEKDTAGLILQNNDLVILGALTEERLLQILGNLKSAATAEMKPLSEMAFFDVEGIQMGMPEAQFTQQHSDASKQVSGETNTYVVKQTDLIWYSFEFHNQKLRVVRVVGPTKVSPASMPPELTHDDQIRLTKEWMSELKEASNGEVESIELGRIKEGYPYLIKGFAYTLSQFCSDTMAVLESSSLQLIVTFFAADLMGDDKAYLTFDRVQKIAPKKDAKSDYEPTDFLIILEGSEHEIPANMSDAPLADQNETIEGSTKFLAVAIAIVLMMFAIFGFKSHTKKSG